MSLINDALKLARQQNPTASAAAVAPALLPVEHNTHSHHSPFKSVVPIMIAVALTSSAFLLWQWSHGGTVVHARTADVTVTPPPMSASVPLTRAAAMHGDTLPAEIPSTPTPTPVIPTMAKVAAPVAPPVIPAAAKIPATTMPALTLAPAPVAAPAPAPVVAVAPAPVATVAPVEPVVAAVQQPAPSPANYRLQSLFYRPKNPSAVINGKTVYIGSRIENAKVTEIGPDMVMLQTATGQTIKVELP